MTKVCVEQFPYPEVVKLNTKDRRKSAGFYMDEFLRSNLDPLCESILDDWHFLIVITGSGEVRVGKSTIAQQVAAYLTYQTNKVWNVNNTFDLSNIVFNSEDLITRSFEKPKGSCLILDEGDDTTGHYASETAQSLKRYFRKCGQLNQFVILILPDFFDLPKLYAIGRSVCLINVKTTSFKRGFFDFYNKDKKRLLYLLGRKMLDYRAVEPNFKGEFDVYYPVPELEYKALKHQDLEREEENHKKGKPSKIFSDVAFVRMVNYLRANLKLSYNQINELFYDGKINVDSFRSALSKVINSKNNKPELIDYKEVEASIE